MKLNPKIEHNIIIAFLLAVWAFLFGFFARPFEHGNMDLGVWLRVSLGFSFAAFFSYSVVAIYQKIIYTKNFQVECFFRNKYLYSILYNLYYHNLLFL